MWHACKGKTENLSMKNNRAQKKREEKESFVRKARKVILHKYGKLFVVGGIL